MNYRSEIDGLRAVAVLPVILFHAGFSVFSGGYVGVDIFFVISGYLITSILVSELEQGTFSIARFYERRARRILPALFFVMLACIPFAYMWMLPSQLKDFAQSLVAVVFFASNILFWQETGYFAADSELKPLLHTWSLAVEEQYYLLFPIFLLLAWRFGRSRVLWSIVAIAAVSLLLAEWGWRNAPDANFYLAPTRAWELLAGSICAFLTVNRTLKSNNVLSAIGLTAIVFAIFGFDENTPFPSVYALVPVVGTSLIILFGGQGTWVAKLLSMRGFVGIGLISYSAYLWHQPLFAFARLRSLTEPSHSLMGALAVAALVMAWATWRWIEQPFRKGARPLLASRSAVFAASGVVGAAFVAAGVAVHLGGGLPDRYDPRVIQSWADARMKSSVYIAENRFDDGGCVFSAAQLNDDIANRILDCKTIHGSGVLVFGDSHATNLFHSIVSSRSEALPPFLVGITSNGCHLPELLDGCPYSGIFQFVESNAEAFSSVIYEKAGYEMLSADIGTDIKAAIRHGGNVVVNEELVSGVFAWLRSMSEFVPIIWYGPRLSPMISEIEYFRRSCNGDFSISAMHSQVYDQLDSHLEGLFAQETGLRYISQIDALNFVYPEDFGGCDSLFWMDKNHFSPTGEERFGKRFNILDAVLE